MMSKSLQLWKDASGQDIAEFFERTAAQKQGATRAKAPAFAPDY